MDEKTKLMVSLGAATAANCIPCFEHLYYKAKNLSLNDDVIQEVVDISTQVKSGAHIAIKTSISDIMGIKLNETERDVKLNLQTCPCDCNS